MDANTEDLKQRTFKIPLLREHVNSRRPQLLVDALTIIRAYNSALSGEQPPAEMPVRLSSFERWSRLCREPLIWLGLADPIITQNETDDGRLSIGAIFTALHAHFADRPFTAMDISRLVGGIVDSNGDLAALMMQNGCTEPNSPMKTGYWLRGYRDRISAGLKLVHAGYVKTGVRWKFTVVGEELVNG
jgi:hypothetical protein